MKNILITGISGQDGIFLTNKLLRDKNNHVVGISRSSNNKILQKKTFIIRKNKF